MARRATSSTKRQPRETAPADAADQVAATASRRITRARRDDTTDAEMSVADAFFPGADPMAETKATRSDAGKPAKARRGRKPKPQPLSDNPTPQVS